MDLDNSPIEPVPLSCNSNYSSYYFISGNEERLLNNNGMVLDNTVVQWNLYLCCVIPTNQVVIPFQALKNGHKTTMYGS
jgi:hypothetical protein